MQSSYMKRELETCKFISNFKHEVTLLQYQVYTFKPQYLKKYIYIGNLMVITNIFPVQKPSKKNAMFLGPPVNIQNNCIFQYPTEKKCMFCVSPNLDHQIPLQ